MALGWLGGDGDVPYGRATESDDDVVFSDSNVLENQVHTYIIGDGGLRARSFDNKLDRHGHFL